MTYIYRDVIKGGFQDRIRLKDGVDYRELTEKALDVYSNSDFRFYTDLLGTYYVSMNDTPVEVGTIEDVNAYLESFSEEV